MFKKLIISEFEFAQQVAQIDEPPKTFIQIIKRGYEDRLPKKSASIYWEWHCMREIFVSTKKHAIIIRLWYPPVLCGAKEQIRRKLWWTAQFVKEMWRRKTFKVTKEQVHHRLEAKAQKALTVKIK